MRVDDNTDKGSIRSKHAVGTMPDSLSCHGQNTKFSDPFIIELWTEKPVVEILLQNAYTCSYGPDPHSCVVLLSAMCLVF